MQNRRQAILKAIISEYLDTAEPVGSKTIMQSYNINVSPATIRSDMANLEKEGFLLQPYTSAGRIPTDKAYRVFVDDIMQDLSPAPSLESILTDYRKALIDQKIKREMFDAINLLSKFSTNAAFATLPNSRTFFLGMSNIIKKPEFLKDPLVASRVVEVFEDNDNFLNFLQSLNLKEDKIEILIGKENILPEIQSCSVILSKYNLKGFKGTIGILGPTRMNYKLNSLLLKETIKDLNKY